MNIERIAQRIAKVAWDTGRIEARDVTAIQMAVIDELYAAQAVVRPNTVQQAQPKTLPLDMEGVPLDAKRGKASGVR